jgi:undecaprenyl diphosphate synthase
MAGESGNGLHVAVIMDGNGRWAMRQGLHRVAGHRAGVMAARRIVEHASEVGVRCLTLYAFSSDNWRRPAKEVEAVFWLLRAFLRMETARLRERGVRFEAIGRRDRVPGAGMRAIEKAERATANGRGLYLRVAIDYSSRDAIARAACDAALWVDGARTGQMRQVMTDALTGDCGDVDLLIRTGGEKRLSDFLLWECAYAELVFAERMWPEFNDADLDAAIREFRHRERRFGGVPDGREQATPAGTNRPQGTPAGTKGTRGQASGARRLKRAEVAEQLGVV